MGKDKKLWYRATRLSGNSSKSNWDRDMAVVTDAMQKLGINVVNAWPAGNGKLAIVVLAYMQEVDFIISKSLLSITLPNQDPPISGSLIPSVITISKPYTQIDPVYAFEVATTKSILTDMDHFNKQVHAVALNITPPCLLWDINTTGAFAKKVVATINNARELLESRLDQFEVKLNNICREALLNFSVVEKRLSVMEDGMKQVTGAITQMRLTLQNTQMAVLVQHQRVQLSDHQSSLD
ncbi:hypothetical protein ARMGADRAFT_1031472 [Armillaria gallica]|uniref:Uncharacterized protein n=1 Tax=Armillaria gallica TaxID=47427 RepID=A0A2H3DKK1_ARMGA|nr:hypothetical protein ARMGADRAFT_1031472 [Armillaria gallica]